MREASVTRSAQNGAQERAPVIAQIRASIARNCARYAKDPDASSTAMDLVLTLRRTATSFQSMAEAYTKLHELSPTKASIVLTLAAAPNYTLPQAQIGRELFVSLGNLTALLASLEEEGLIKRRPDPGDGRVTNVSLTAMGVRFLKRFAPVHYATVTAAVRVLSRTEQRTLIGLLDKLNDLPGTTTPVSPASRKKHAEAVREDE